MKKMLVTTLILVFFSFVTKAQNSLGIAVGTKIIYEATVKPKVKYDIVFTVKSMSAAAITFSWYGNGKTGTFTLNRKALTSSKKMISDFKNGEAGKWDVQSALLLPTEAFSELYNKGNLTTTINAEAKPKSFQKVMERGYEYTHNGVKKTCNAILAAHENSAKNYIVLVLNDKSFPLLVAMDWNIRLTLKSIQTV